ncbi:MAG: 50S ribosomal protein L22 [Patescibacteria group bacterium]|jgi:large subunit ribosomal protein L22|nr:50S ribosomal protein L22 [Patescibacteria group bacterium]
MKATKVRASLRNYRRSASKVRDVANIIRGAMVSEAEIKLSAVSKHSGEDILKLVKSAVANAENNFKLDKKDLFISEIKVDEGAVLKRWRARAYGRAAQILKRSCHINIVLEAVETKEVKATEKVKTVEKVNSEKIGNDKKKKPGKEKDSGNKKKVSDK